jgi:hypothetical protein
MNSMLFICIVLNAIVSVPLIFYNATDPRLAPVLKYAPLFMLSLFSLIGFFLVSRTNRDKEQGPMKFVNFFLRFPIFLAVSMGLSLHNAIATIEGYLGVKSPFVRTPKFNIRDSKDTWKGTNIYLSRKLAPVTYMEGFLLLYFLFGIGLGIFYDNYAMFPFHIMLIFGYATVFYYSVRHALYSPQ